jgi:hypothetical protein
VVTPKNQLGMDDINLAGSIAVLAGMGLALRLLALGILYFKKSSLQ